MTQGPDYTLTDRWMSNIDAAMRNPYAGWIFHKIQAHLQRTGQDSSYEKILSIQEQIKKDRVLASFFCKDPSKQSSHQTIFYNWAKTELKEYVHTFEKLPTRGIGSLFVCQGQVLPFGHPSLMEATDAKSIDFLIRKDNRSVFVSHKYTGQEGGAQDNQYRDIHLFLQQARRNTQANRLFLAVCDGPYYIRKSCENPALSRLSYLNAQSGSTSAALGSSDFLAWIKNALHVDPQHI